MESEIQRPYHGTKMDKREEEIGSLGWIKKADNRGKKRMFIILKIFCNTFTCLREFLFTAQKKVRNESYKKKREKQKVMNYGKEKNDMRRERKMSRGTKVLAKWL